MSIDTKRENAPDPPDDETSSTCSPATVEVDSPQLPDPPGDSNTLPFQDVFDSKPEAVAVRIQVPALSDETNYVAYTPRKPNETKSIVVYVPSCDVTPEKPPSLLQNMSPEEISSLVEYDDAVVPNEVASIATDQALSLPGYIFAC
jgi:hypothetical protein